MNILKTSVGRWASFTHRHRNVCKISRVFVILKEMIVKLGDFINFKVPFPTESINFR